MKIKDIKAGGWVRYISDGAIELAKVREFKYYKGITNGYCFDFEGQDYSSLFERGTFNYSDNVADLIKKGEVIIELRGHCIICNSYTKDEFVEKFRGCRPIKAVLITVLEGCGAEDDPYREETYIVQMGEKSAVVLGKCDCSVINLDLDEKLYRSEE